MYKGYDFQGYVVYKSKNGSDWRILAQCDLADSITFKGDLRYRYESINDD